MERTAVNISMHNDISDSMTAFIHYEIYHGIYKSIFNGIIMKYFNAQNGYKQQYK